jgi:hypothetical protein
MSPFLAPAVIFGGFFLFMLIAIVCGVRSTWREL